MEGDHVGNKARVALPEHEQIKYGLCHEQCVGEENKNPPLFMAKSLACASTQPPHIYRTKKYKIDIHNKYRTLHPIQTKTESNRKFSHFWGIIIKRYCGLHAFLIILCQSCCSVQHLENVTHGALLLIPTLGKMSTWNHLS